MPKRSSTPLLFIFAALVVAAYFYTQTYQGFQDASGNTTTTTINLPSWSWVLIGLAVLVVIGLTIWSFVLQTKGTYSALSGVGSGIANAGAGVRNWGKSLLK
jgi:archaellum biogenesis protein FlaJ (TadC family)